MKKLLVMMALLCFAAVASADSYGNSGYQGSKPRASSIFTNGDFDGTCAGTDTIQECLDELDDAVGGGATNINDIGDATDNGSISIGSYTITLSGSGLFAVTTNTTHTGTLAIPQGTAPVVDAAGEIAIDTTDDQLVYYGGAKRVLTYKRPGGFTVESPTTADDGVPIFSHGDSITVTNMRCYAVGGTSAEITLTDGSNALDTMTCDTDGATDDGSIANATFSAGEQMFYNTGTVTGSVTWVNFMFDYVIVAE